MGRSPDRSGPRWPQLALVLPPLGVLGAAPAVVAYLQLTQAEQLSGSPSWWYLAAAAPVGALVAVGWAGGWPGRVAAPTVARRTATLLAGMVAAAMTVLVFAGRTLDTDGPGRSVLAAAAAAAVVGLIAVLLLRRRRPAATREPRGGRRGPYLGNTTPRPGQIWWGIVPFHGTEELVHRPFLVVALSGRTLTVLPITKKDNTNRRDYVPFRPDPAMSSLGPGSMQMRPCEIDLRDLDRRRSPEPCPESLWRRVQAQFAPPPLSSAPTAPAPRSPNGRSSSGRSSSGRH